MGKPKQYGPHEEVIVKYINSRETTVKIRQIAKHLDAKDMSISMNTLSGRLYSLKRQKKVKSVGHGLWEPVK